MNRYTFISLLVLASSGLYAQQHRSTITLTIGDITRQPFEDPAHSAIVNAANRRKMALLRSFPSFEGQTTLLNSAFKL